MRKLVGALLIGVGLLTGAGEAFAHARNYVWTTEYLTLPQGEFELENWVTFAVPDGGKTNENAIQYQEELEYGITDRLNVAHYERWKTINQVGPDDSTVYEGFKFETKYRFGEKGKWWVDPLLYLELKTDVRNEHNVNSLEEKIVLSKDLEKFNVVYNQIMESELDHGGRTEQAFALAGSYEIFSGFRAGAEFTGQFWAPASNRNELSLGPTLAYQHKYFWIAAGGRFALNHAANDAEARVVVGIPF